MKYIYFSGWDNLNKETKPHLVEEEVVQWENTEIVNQIPIQCEWEIHLREKWNECHRQMIIDVEMTEVIHVIEKEIVIVAVIKIAECHHGAVHRLQMFGNVLVVQDVLDQEVDQGN